MKLEYYLIACAIIAVSLLRVHSYVNERYSGVQFYQQQAEALAYQKEQLALRQAKQDYQNKLFQQHIAAYLPTLQKENAYVARNIASVISDKKIDFPVDKFTPSFDKAKDFFSEGNFASAVSLLENLRQQYPSNPKAVEVCYLLMESYYQLKQEADAVDMIENILQLYPESNLAAYALIRLGDYYLAEDDKDKAEYCYHYAMENFSYDKKVVELAAKKIGSLP